MAVTNRCSEADPILPPSHGLRVRRIYSAGLSPSLDMCSPRIAHYSVDKLSVQFLTIGGVAPVSPRVPVHSRHSVR